MKNFLHSIFFSLSFSSISSHSICIFTCGFFCVKNLPTARMSLREKTREEEREGEKEEREREKVKLWVS